MNDKPRTKAKPIEKEIELPSDTTLERSLLGGILVYPNEFNDVRDLLCEDTFTNATCRAIYKAIVKVEEDGGVIDQLRVMIEAEKMGVTNSDVMEIMSEKTYTLVGVASHLQEKKERRDLYRLGKNVAELAAEHLDTTVEEIHDMLRNHLDNVNDSIQTTDLGDGVAELNEHIQNNIKGIKTDGTPTGFNQLDKSGGLHAGNLIVVAGATSHGKTSFALSLALNAIEKGKKVGYFSLEMVKKELTARLVAMRSHVAVTDILYSIPYREDFEKIMEAEESLPLHNLIFDDRSTSNLNMICSSIRKMKSKHGIHGVVIDYLQILNINEGSRENQEQLLAGATRKLKNLAHELNIWIMLLSQLNRTGGGSNEQPTLSRLRGSGQIAEAADIVILIYRPEACGMRYAEPQFKDVSPHDTVLVDVAKGRNIGTGKFVCGFVPKYTLFIEDQSLMGGGVKPAPVNPVPVNPDTTMEAQLEQEEDECFTLREEDLTF